MKLLFLLLVLANLGFYAYSQGYFPQPADAVDETMRQPLNPEKIHILNASQVAALPKVKPPSKLASCLEWGTFSVSDATKAEQALQGLALGDRMSERRIEDAGSWWVYLPPQGSKANADKKIGELKRLGVEDYFVVQDEGKWHFAISLGIFSSKDAATKQLDVVRAKGVRSALAAERQTASTRVMVQIRDGGDPAVARVNDVKGNYPGTEAKACAVPDDKRA
jgi:sporulation related protein